SQTITTVQGTYYTLSFWLANDNPGDTGVTTFAVQWNDAVNMTTSTVYSLPSPQPSFPYTQVVITVMATSNSMTLAFVAEQDPSQWFLDDVSLVATVNSAVKVNSFTARPDGGGNLIELKTGRDVNNLGFNLYRESDGQRVKLNASLLAGTAFMGGAGTTFTAGQSHHWRDVGAGAGAVYWLEEVDLNGTRTWYGPAVSQDVTESAAAAGSTPTVQTLRAKSAPTGRASAQDDADTIALSSVGSVRGTPGGKGSSGALAVSAPGATAPAAPSPQAIAQQYALAAGPAVRLDVDSEGWYRVTQPQLVAAGISANVNPHDLQLYLDGVQQDRK